MQSELLEQYEENYLDDYEFVYFVNHEWNCWSEQIEDQYRRRYSNVVERPVSDFTHLFRILKDIDSSVIIPDTVLMLISEFTLGTSI